MLARKCSGLRMAPGQMTSIDPYSVGADSISARGALLAAPGLRAGTVRPYLQFSLDL